MLRGSDALTRRLAEAIAQQSLDGVSYTTPPPDELLDLAADVLVERYGFERDTALALLRGNH